MHRVVTKLFALSLAASSLPACKHVCHTPVHETRTALAERGEGAAGIVAATYAELGLTSGVRSYSGRQCAAACGPRATGCEVSVVLRGPEERPTSSEGTVTCRLAGDEVCREDFDPLNLGSCPYGCGRLPAFVDPESAPTAPTLTSPLVLELGRIAVLESLAVAAFAELSRDLARLGLLAGELDARIARAREDERRHARQARAVLRRLGARADRTPRVLARRRGLEAVATGNAVEGCVRESFGAVVACVQARAARDPVVRAYFRAIAVDELRHAALSWDVHTRLMARLPAEARARVLAAQRGALAELSLGVEPHPEVRDRAGAPSRREQRALAQAMAEALPYAASASPEAA